MIDAVMYGMMPSANMVNRRMFPPENISKKLNSDPLDEFMNCCHAVVFVPGVGTCPPRRYTASSASVKNRRLRRSGTRKILANASKNFMGSLRFPAAYFAAAPITCAVPPAF